MKGIVIGAIVFIILLIILAGKVDLPKPEGMTYPKPTGYVVDEVGVLSQETVDTATEELRKFDEDKKLGQIAVLIVKTTQPLAIEEYSIDLAEEWKVGYEGEDNGIIFIIATEDRKTRIEVGRGFEGILTDAGAGRLLDTDVIPYLKEDDWNGAVLSAVQSLIEVVGGGETQ